MPLRLALVLLVAACAGPASDYTPPIAVSPGFESRIALMDRYRLHDEQRRMTMDRPRVWVEDVPEDEDAGADDTDASLQIEPGGLR